VFFSPYNPFNPKIHIPFYALAIFYYCFACYVYLPYIFRRHQNNLIRFGSIIILLGIYTLFYAIFNTLLASLLRREWIFFISKSDWKLSSARSVYILGIAVGVWMGRYLIMTVKKNAEFKIQKLEMEKHLVKLENAFLRSQLAPHLMYNSLSSIYNQVVNQAPEAPDTIKLLTDLLDYSLANSKEGDTVTLEVDLSIIKKSIKLHRLLTNGKFYVNYTAELDEEGVQIAPLILQTFVDNILKHGDVSDPDSPGIIEIKLTNRKLHLFTKNKYSPELSQTKRGIGLKNAQQRLSILYPDRHSLSAVQGITHYEVNLMILL
jgi:two-component system LytT family sensor kinase